MKIKAFFPAPPSGPNFADILIKDLADKEGEFFLVSAEYVRPGTNDNMTDFRGLDIALTLNPEESPIIFCSFMPESYFASNKQLSHKFYALMAKNRVGFARIPEILAPGQWFAKYKELLLQTKEEDTLALEINLTTLYEEKMGTIQHRVQLCFRDNTEHSKSEIAWAVSEAKNIGVTGSDEEIALQIQNFKRKPVNSIYAGKYFPGIFCDIEGTLFKDGMINEILIKTLQSLSRSKPITLWTGGDIDSLKKLLITNGITWKLVSKSSFTGAEVESAFDDEEFDVFFEKYQIKVRDYTKI
jgi:hypothetical protein